MKIERDERRFDFHDIGLAIKRAREANGMTQEQLAYIVDRAPRMLISFPPKYSISYVMGYLKGKSSLMIFDRHANLKYKYGNRHFWARGYFVDTAGKNKKKIQEYIIVLRLEQNKFRKKI